MSHSSIDSLMEIAEAQATSQLTVLQRRQSDLAYLKEQRRELISYCETYKKSLTEILDGRPTLISHRLRFISNLTGQIRELDERVQMLLLEVAQCEASWRQQLARQQAIQAIHEDRQKQALYETNRREQKDLEEISRMTRRPSGSRHLTKECKDV